MAPAVRSYLNQLTLRQGAILIVTIELFLSTFVLILLLLSSSEARHLAEMLERDVQESAQREGITLLDEAPTVIRLPVSGGTGSRAGGVNESEIRLGSGQHLALIVRFSLYAGITLGVVHMVSGVLLLYGAITRFHQLMMPWILIEAAGLVMLCTIMLVTMYLLHSYLSIVVFFVGSIVISIGFYNWLIVYCHYQELSEMRKPKDSVRHHMLKPKNFVKLPDDSCNL